jgi:DNA-binding NarL/FixJ family response regulator
MTSGSLAAASAGRAVLTDIWMVAGSGPIRSVLICDDRPGILQNLVDMLRPLPALVDIDWVTDGFALVDAITARRVDLVLVGIHRANTAGAEAISLLLGMHPTAVIIVFGAPTEIDVLADAYLRGARGLLLWHPNHTVAS